jgi:phosphoglycolate phosphatase
VRQDQQPSLSALRADDLSALQAVLFDLDGTLLDTVADIEAALTRALAEQSLPPLPQAQVRTLIGRGVPVLIQRVAASLAAAGERPDGAALLASFQRHYQWIHQQDELRTCAYPGVSAGLAQLHDLGLRLAVVTNKPHPAAVAVLARCDLARWINVVIGGDPGVPPKPHPQPLLAACRQLGVAPARAVMVGDSMVDVLAARAAGVAVVCVPYGYNEGADPRELPCDLLVEGIGDFAALLTASRGSVGAGAQPQR